MIEGFDLAAFVGATLAEDLGSGGDITSKAVIPADARLDAVMDSRDAVVVAGLPLAEAFFRALDPECSIEYLVRDGDVVPVGAHLMRISGNARALLAAISVRQSWIVASVAAWFASAARSNLSNTLSVVVLMVSEFRGFLGHHQQRVVAVHLDGFQLTNPSQVIP